MIKNGSGLRHLSVEGRRSIADVAALRGLEFLHVGVAGVAGLDFLGDKPELEMLSLRCLQKGATMDLSGLEGATNLTRLDTEGFDISTLAPLRQLHRLEELWLIGPWSKRDESLAALDLGPLADLPELHDLRVTGMSRPIASLRPVLRMAAIRAVRLAGSIVLGGDLQPLLDLPSSVEVGPPDNHRRHSHRFNDIMRARGAT